MRRVLLTALLFLVLAALLIQPALLPSRDITSRPERAILPDTETVSPLSHLAVQVQVPLDQLEQAANEEIPQELANKRDNKGSTRTHIIVERNGLAQLTAEGNQLRLAVPIKFSARAKFKKVISASTRTSGKATVLLNIRLGIGPDWRGQLHIDPSYRWDRAPKIKLGPIKINIGDQVGKELQQALDKGARKASEKAATKLDLRGKAEAEWAKLHQPRQLHDDPAVWLIAQPQRVMLAPVLAAGEHLQFSFGIDTKLGLVVGTEPSPVTAMPLPPLESMDDKGGRFEVHVPVLIDYAGLKKELESSLAGKRVKLDRGAITPRDFDVYPSGRAIVVGVNFEGDAPGWWFDTKGTVYLTGEPVFDTTRNVFSIEGFDFTRRVDNPLIGTATWVLQDSLRDKLRQHLSYDLTEHVATARQDLQEELQQPIGERLSLGGEVTKLSIGGVSLRDQGIEVLITAEGKALLQAVSPSGTDTTRENDSVESLPPDRES